MMKVNLKLAKKKIIHLLPQDVVGGAESAAKTASNLRSNNYDFYLQFLVNKKIKIRLLANIYGLFEILLSSIKVVKTNPDFILVSLWKSCLSATIIKFINPKIKIILFLHLPRSTNLIDYIFTKYIAKLAYQIWADSKSTIDERCKELSLDLSKNKRIISFVRYKLEPNTEICFEPNFIFWGRFHSQKRIALALILFKEIYEKYRKAKFLLIGPDCGELKSLKIFTKNHNLDKNVSFFNSMGINEIAKYSKNCAFFLQLSSQEGLGMSIVESMQLGLIPIVTDIGEIKNYCSHKENSIIFSSLLETSEEVCQLINNKDERIRLRGNAINTWSGISTYREDISTAFDELI